MNEGVINRKRSLEKELKRITSVLEEKYTPEKIILFGSLANGKVKEWSDIDLFIIKKTYKKYLNRVEEVFHLIHPKVGIDIFVLTPEEIKKSLKENNPYIQEIILEGNLLYEKRG